MTGIPVCDACAVAAESAATRGGVVECVCGEVHGSRRASTTPRTGLRSGARARDGRVWRAPEGDAPAAAAVGAAATTLASHGYNVLVVSLADEEMRRIRLEELRDAS